MAGGPHELARYIRQLVDSDGKDTAACGARHEDRPEPQIQAWVSRKAATSRQELTLSDLKRIQRG
ncbi:hypothetical protein ABZS94_28905 [Streptomyces sp. NPDC005500]|uniref:hypothetical protein n=1 Tax=Streptomyces sp. NPDC005500 TaxID=3155007 RepID=UPI0033B8589E